MGIRKTLAAARYIALIRLIDASVLVCVTGSCAPVKIIGLLKLWK